MPGVFQCHRQVGEGFGHFLAGFQVLLVDVFPASRRLSSSKRLWWNADPGLVSKELLLIEKADIVCKRPPRRAGLNGQVQLAAFQHGPRRPCPFAPGPDSNARETASAIRSDAKRARLRRPLTSAWPTLELRTQQDDQTVGLAAQPGRMDSRLATKPAL